MSKNRSKKKLLFTFAHLLGSPFSSGGDVFGYNMAKFSQAEGNFDVGVLIPQVSAKFFTEVDKILLKNDWVEQKIFNTNEVYTILPLYISRLIRAVSTILKGSYETIYTTGDFFCDVIPTYIYVKKNPKTKWIALIHHINPNPFKRNNPFVRSLVSFLVQQISLIFIRDLAEVVFTPSQNLKRQLMSMGFKKEIVVTGAGLDVENIRRNLPKNPQVSKKNTHLVFLGRLNETKGIYDIPYIFSRVLEKAPQVELDLIGACSSTTKKALEEVFYQYKCNNKVNYHGYVEDITKVYDLLYQAKVFIFPSYEEGWGITLFESILCNTYPVVYELNVFKEMFGPEMEYIPLGNREAFANKIVEIIKMSPADYQHKVDIYKKIAQKHSWKNVYNLQRKYF